MNISNICNDLCQMALAIQSELGGGFPESVDQNALAIELRERNIKYMKEVNIEIFYKGHSIGNDRPDFILLPPGKRNWDLKNPIVLETKVAPNLTNDHRQQLKSYLKSFPHNKNASLHGIKYGILLKFLKSEDFNTPEKIKEAVELELWYLNKRTGEMNKKFVLPENNK